MTKAGNVYTTKLAIVEDRRATFSLADRAANFAAAERISALFGRMSDLVAQINALRDAATAKHQPDVAAKAEALRKEIVATKEGGAITGEERLREYTDDLYGSIASWEGAPAAYQVKRIDVLGAQLAGIARRFAALVKSSGLAIEPVHAADVTPGGGTGDAATRGLAGWGLRIYPDGKVYGTSEAAAERD
jgi:hypothetical protein